MKSFEKDILKLAEKTRLKAIEREMVRDRILSYMEYHPLKKDHDVRGAAYFMERTDFFYIHVNTPLAKLVGGLFVLALIVGVPLVAERTVPGDTLYLVKTGINETIRTQFATSPYAKVQLETKFIERRLAEARLLAEEGKLTVEVEAKIAETVKGHAEAVQNGIAELRADDADGAAMAEIEFNSALEVQSVVLNETGDASTTQGDALRAVVDTVRNDTVSDENLATPSFVNLIARIESETTRAYELFESVKDSATDEEIKDMERRLDDINRTITEAKALQSEDEPTAVTELIEVLGLVQKLITFMTDIDVREAVTLESLVPMKLTDEERKGIVSTRLSDIAVRIDTFVAVASSSLSDEVLSKVGVSIEQVRDLSSRAHDALGENDFSTAEIQSGEAEAMVRDLEALVLGYAPTPSPDTVPEDTLPLPLDVSATTTITTATTTPEVTSTTTEPITPEVTGDNSEPTL
jgi:Domain of unknown function (DUF5667)